MNEVIYDKYLLVWYFHSRCFAKLEQRIVQVINVQTFLSVLKINLPSAVDAYFEYTYIPTMKLQVNIKVNQEMTTNENNICDNNQTISFRW